MTPAANERPACSRCYRGTVDRAELCSTCFAHATRRLGDGQLALLCRVHALAGRELALEQHEIGPAMGLERRGLLRTDRAEVRGNRFLRARPRYERGSKRWARLTAPGRAFVEAMPAERRERYLARSIPAPTFDEVRTLARELAEGILAGEGESQRLRNRARGVIERLRGEAGT